MTVLESALETYFNAQVRKRTGGKAIKLAPTQRGVPDRLVVMPPGELFLVELKTTKGKLSEIQVFWHQQLAALGVRVYTLHGKIDIDQWITARLNEVHERHVDDNELARLRRRRAELEQRAEERGRR